jgi:hypothetical protein
MIKVRLTKKLAARLNGVDVSALHVGDLLELPDRTAYILIAEGWAERVADGCAIATPQVPIQQSSGTP